MKCRWQTSFVVCHLLLVVKMIAREFGPSNSAYPGVYFFSHSAIAARITA